MLTDWAYNCVSLSLAADFTHFAIMIFILFLSSFHAQFLNIAWVVIALWA